MTESQEAHLRNILREFATKTDVKYRKGQAEHGGNLLDMSELGLVDNILDEAIDQVVYVITLRNKIMMRGISAQQSS